MAGLNYEYKVIRLGKALRLLDNPPSASAFLSEEHYRNFELLRGLIEKKAVKPKVSYYIIDHANDKMYEYWVQGVEYGDSLYYIIVGTDDSGKLFVEDGHMPNIRLDEVNNKFVLRQDLFGFEYHWFEDFELIEFNVPVRLQGDLIAQVRLATKKALEEYLETRALHQSVVRYSLMRGDESLAVADDDAIFRMHAFTHANLKLDIIDYEEVKRLEEKYREEYLIRGERIRVKWGRYPRYHVIEFRGARLGPRAFLVKRGKLKVSHPEHGTNEIEWGKDVIIEL